MDEENVKYKKRKDECIVSSCKDIHDYPIFGDGSNKLKTILKFRIKKLGLILIIFVILLCSSTFFIFKSISSKNFKLLKNNYGKYVITDDDALLYNNKKKVAGSISDNLKLELVDIKKLTKKDKYLKIKDTNYYVYYKDIKKAKDDKNDNNSSYYIDLGKDIVGEGKIELYKDKKKIITLKNGIKAPIKYIDNDNYYVYYLNDTYRIKKTKNIKEVDGTNSNEKEAEHISVLYYDVIDDACESDNCFKLASVKAHIEKIKENGFYPITMDEFVSYINGYIKLKDKAVLFMSNNPNDNTKVLKDELGVEFFKYDESKGIKFSSTNKAATPNDDKNAVSFYNIKRYFLIDDYVRMANGEEIYDNGPQTDEYHGVPVINYHFFYDASTEECNETICLDSAKFREQLQWLSDNGYKTLTIKEFADWMDGIIEVPRNSVLLTVDDGGMGTGTQNGNKLIPLLEEFKMHATLFLVAGWSDIGWKIENYQSKYLDVQSHSYDLHHEASCADGRGKVACSSYQEVKDDLQKSIDVVKDKTSFCFPFYSSDRESIQAIQDLGFRVAFVGGSVNARRSNNKYQIPRYPILSDISLNGFINIVS